jgi:2-amino-4-hydroxy-6-hydroxymethyldihydropteridine diphosphokinase
MSDSPCNPAHAREGQWGGKGGAGKGVEAFVALGSNLGDSVRVLDTALKRLQDCSDRPLRCSSFWRTAPVHCPPASPWFVNAVAALAPRVDETPERLLERLLTLERELGRQPKRITNEPRTLDLDLIAYGDEVRSTARLTLPHPRAHQRAFVLAPLSELAAQMILPGQDQTVVELLAALDPAAGMTRLPREM